MKEHVRRTRLESNTETGDASSSNHESDTGRSHLEDDTNGEQDATSEDSGSSTEHVGAVTSDQSTNTGSGGEDGSDEGFLGSGDLEQFLGGSGGSGETGNHGDVVFHTQDTRDPSDIVSKEETTD